MWPPRISDHHFKGCLDEATTCLSPQFLFSPLWLLPVSSQALFPVTISWWICSPYLPSSEPESTDLSVWPVQSSEHCEDCPFLSDCSGPEMMSTWCCLRSSSLLHPFFRRLPVPQLLGLTWTSIIVWELLLACFSPGLRQHSATPQAPHSSPVGTYQVPLAKWLCVQYFQHPRMWGWGRLF